MDTSLKLHPLCDLFPRLGGQDFEALKADIQAHGLREPIVVLDGAILDGGNRYRACVEAGIRPDTVPFIDGDPLAFVLSENLHRRHLSPGQQAAIVAAASDWRNAHMPGGNGSNQYGRKEQSGNVAALLTIEDRAAQSGASKRTQRMADKIAKADPELVKKVAHGEITLPQAAGQVATSRATARATGGASSRTYPRARAKPKRTADASERDVATANDQRRSRVTEAIRTLAETDVHPRDLQGLMKPFEYPQVTDFMHKAFRYLDALLFTWKT